MKKKLVKKNLKEIINGYKEREESISQILFLQRNYQANIRKHIHNDAYGLKEVDYIYNKDTSSRRAGWVLKQNSIMPSVPYFPPNDKCLDQSLAKRIYENAAQVKFVKNIHHITSKSHLDSILDHGLLGQEILSTNKIHFSRSALNYKHEVGDRNVVCFAIDDVDGLTFKGGDTLKINVDFEKVISEKFLPGKLFFKEHDLFFKTENRSFGFANQPQHFIIGKPSSTCGKLIKIGKFKFIIDRSLSAFNIVDVDANKRYCKVYYTGKKKVPQYKWDEFKKRGDNVEELVVKKDIGETFFYGEPKDISQFFIMQFFRHIDDFSIRDEIYKELSHLKDAEMQELFLEIGTYLSKRSEVNFQGGWYLPIEYITSFEILKKKEGTKGYIPLYSTMFSNYEVYNPDDYIQRKDDYSGENITHGCNFKFSHKDYDRITIKMNDIIDAIIPENDNLEQLLKFQELLPKAFKSVRFVNYLMSCTKEGMQCYKMLASLLENNIESPFYSNTLK